MINSPSAKGKALTEKSVFQTNFARCFTAPDSKRQVQSEQNTQPPLYSQPQCPMEPKSISTAAPSSLYPIIPSSWLAEAASCSILVDLLPKPESLSVAGPLNAPGSEQRDSYQRQQDPDWIELKVAPPVKALQNFAPDAQVGEANAVQAQPVTGLAGQPDEGVQHEMPQHLAERDQLISVDLPMDSGQGEEPWIVRRAVETVSATKPAFKNAPSAEADTNSCKT